MWAKEKIIQLLCRVGGRSFLLPHTSFPSSPLSKWINKKTQVVFKLEFCWDLFKLFISPACMCARGGVYIYNIYVLIIFWHFSTFAVSYVNWGRKSLFELEWWRKEERWNGFSTCRMCFQLILAMLSSVPLPVLVAEDWFTFFDCLRNKLMRLLETLNICIFTDAY